MILARRFGMAESVKRPMGRPPKGAPEPIPDTIENIIQVVVKTRKPILKK